MLDINSWLGLPPDISTHGYKVDALIGWTHWLMLILFIGWAVFFIYVLIRFRAGRNPQADYAGTKGKWAKYHEGAVVVAETVLLLGFAIPIWGFLKSDFPPANEALEVHVVAEQFAWNFHYPGPDGVFGKRDAQMVDTQLNPLGLDRADPFAADDIATVNELNFPVNTPIIAHISSKDVIHSFSVNALRVKQDAVPGILIPIWFEATETGEFEVACAQLCGLSHYRMRAFVTVQEQAEYDEWIAERAAEMQQFGTL